MFCDEALDAVEAIAAGELMADGRVAAHLASCPNCGLALEGARRLERSLRQRPVPAPSAQFTSRTITRVRRAQWRSDQFLDLGLPCIDLGRLIRAGQKSRAPVLVSLRR
jgi:hypothetical protein